MPPGESFIANYAQRKDVRSRGQGFHLQLLGRHIEQSPLLATRSVRVCHVGHSEVDDLDRVVFHHKNVARLQVAVQQSTLMRRLQAAARLENDFDSALHREPVAGFADEVIQGRARQQRHDEVGLFLPVFFKFSDVKYLDDVGMAHRSQDIAFFVEQLQGSRIGSVKNGFDRNFPANHGIVGAIDQAHSTAPEDLPHLVAPGQFSRGSRGIH